MPVSTANIYKSNTSHVRDCLKNIIPLPPQFPTLLHIIYCDETFIENATALRPTQTTLKLNANTYCKYQLCFLQILSKHKPSFLFQSTNLTFLHHLLHIHNLQSAFFSSIKVNVSFPQGKILSALSLIHI